MVDKKVSGVSYIVCTPDRRKNKRMCHVNMLKGYHDRDDDTKPLLSKRTVYSDISDESENPGDEIVMDSGDCDNNPEYADTLSNLESKCVTPCPKSAVYVS